MLILLVAISWATALGSAFLLRRTVIRGEQTPFVMELPAYHLPHWRSVFAGAGRRTWLYMKKAGTLILAATALMWALMYFPHLEPDPQLTPAAQRAAQLEHSLAGRVGRLAEPVSRWAGFDWRTNIALVGGFAAKEVVVSTLGTAYSLADAGAVEEDEAVQSDLARRLRRDWTPLQAFALMIFVMLYAPCVATVAAMRRESGAWKWPLFSLAYSTVVAFALAVAVYQIGGALSG
jgi:ferrous iron transport protein B